MAEYMRKIVYLSEAQRAELFANGRIIVNGQTIDFNNNDLYMTPEEDITTSLAGKISEPATDGTNGQVLVTDGNGGRSWATITSGVESVNTKTGAIVLDGRDINVDNSAQTPKTIAEGLSDIEDEVSELNRALHEKAPVIISSASGAIASFPDGADDMSIKSLKVWIEPVQDLHGYDNPWPAGGGKNLLNANLFVRTSTTAGNKLTVSDETITMSWVNGGIIGSNREIQTIPAGTYTISATGTNTDLVYARMDAVDNSGTIATAQLCYSKSFTSEKDFYVSLYGSYNNHNTAVFKLQLESGSTATSWAPYSNICPISGRTGANIIHCGINLWDEQWESGDYTYADGLPHTQSTRIRTKNAIRCTPSTNYYFVLPSGKQGQIFYYDINDSYISCTTWMPRKQITTPTNCYYIRFYLVSTTEYTNGVGINYPSTDTSYHAYRGVNIPIDWETEAGTVYGGSLDVTTGLLTVDRAIVGLGTLNWAYASTALNPYFESSTITGASRYAGCICTNYIGIEAQTGNYWTTGPHPLEIGFNRSGGSAYLCVQDPAYTDAPTFKTAMSTSGAKLVYYLATPVTYQLTPTEIRTILGGGINNIWADTGDTEVNYPADTKLYIDRKITEAIASALNA